MIPQQIGKYEIQSELGKGGMGVVYLGLDPSLNRRVAIKVIAPQYLEDAEVQARFVREARVVAGFQHPNIVSVFELSKDAITRAPFIAMEHVDGADLKKLIKDRALIPFERKLELIIQTCQGLHYAHEHDILHRDIKPGNILVGRDGTAHIVDFGLARIKSSDMTQSGLMGTPDYMSPEQANSAKHLDRRSDLFSLGIVLYELVSLTRPFDAETPWQVLTQIASHPHRSLSAVLPGCDDELVHIVNKALQKDPSARFANCLELAEALNAFRRSLPERQVGLQRVVMELRTKLQASSSDGVPNTLAGFCDEFLFDLEPPRSWPANPSGIDFGPCQPDKDYGYLLLSLAETKSQLEAITGKLKAAQRLRTGFMRARDKFEYGRLKECLLVLDEILHAHPGATQAAILKCECLRLLEERSQWDKVPLLVKADLAQAREAMEQGDTERAKRAVSRALQAKPGALEALEIEGQLLSVAELEHRMLTLLEAAQVAFEQYEFRSCLQFLKEGLALSPQHPEFKQLRDRTQHELEIQTLLDSARASLDAKRWRLAHGALAKVLRLDSSRAEALLLKEQVDRRRRTQRKTVLLAAAVLTATLLPWLWFSNLSRVSSRETPGVGRESQEQKSPELEQSRLNQAKHEATEAKANELSPDTYQRAVLLESQGTELEAQGMHLAATQKLAAARDAYAQSEKEAKEAQQQRELLSRQKVPAQRAMQVYAAAKKAADGLGAGELASYRKGLDYASRAQTLWNQSDFPAAQASFELARQAMETSQTEVEAQQLKQDQEAIVGVVDRFEAALNRKDIAAVKLLWPSLSQSEEQKIRAELAGRSFSLRAQKERLPVVRGNLATLTCLFSKQFENADGVIRRSKTRPVFHLLRTPAGWVIQEILE